MKKLITLSLLVAALGFTNMATAQDDDATSSPALSVGAEVAIPTGDLGEAWKLGLGGSLKAAFPVITNGDITVSAGYISFSGKEQTFMGQSFKNPAMNAIPLKAGFRYRFPGGFYLEPQFGYTIFKVKGAGESEGAFTYAGNVGYVINNMIDLAVRYEGASKEGATLSHIGLRAAYTFSL